MQGLRRLGFELAHKLSLHDARVEFHCLEVNFSLIGSLSYIARGTLRIVSLIAWLHVVSLFVLPLLPLIDELLTLLPLGLDLLGVVGKFNDVGAYAGHILSLLLDSVLWRPPRDQEPRACVDDVVRDGIFVLVDIEKRDLVSLAGRTDLLTFCEEVKDLLVRDGVGAESEFVESRLGLRCKP